MLRIVHAPGFKGRSGQAILIAGTRQEIESLKLLLENWSGIDLDLVSELRKSHNVLEGGAQALILKKRGTPYEVSAIRRQDGVGTWIMSDLGIEAVLDLLGGLLGSSRPGHQYLEIGPSGGQIMCSVDEYPEPL